MERRSAPVDVLVLGAGGSAGHAFHAGVLRALAEVRGWDPRSAALIIGTSAGAQVAALLRAGVSADALFAQMRSDPLAFSGSTILHVGDRSRRRWPGSPSYLRAALRRPWRAHLGRLVAALVPESDRVNQRFRVAYGRLFAAGWPREPLWIPSVNIDTGERVVFGRDGSPRTDVGTAVCCSSTVPGLLQPVRVGAARYVDGGVASPTHLDLLDGLDVHRALVLSPLSHFMPLRLLLRWELSRLAHHGVPFEVFEPGGEVSSMIGWNPMDVRQAPAIAEAAYREAVRRLAALPKARCTSPTTDATSR